MNENIINNVTRLKAALHYEIKKYNEMENEIDLISNNISCIMDIIKNLKTSSYQELYDYTSIIYLVLNIIYEENTSKIIYNRVYKIAYNLINAKKNNLDELEIKYKLELEKIINYFENELVELSSKQSDLINTLKTSRKNEYINLLRKIKYREYITKQDFILIEQFLENKSVPEKDQILIFNQIEFNNFIVKKDNGNISKNSFFDYNTIPFMLNLGFEKFDITYISDKGTRNRVEQESKNIINILESDIDINSFLEYLPTIESDEYSYEEVLCILQIVINHFQVELLETVNLISDKDNFKNYRNLIKQEFNNYLNIVTVLQQYYNDEEKKYNDKFDKIDEKEEKNHIFYAFRNEDKSYLEYDLESLNPHYLEKVNRLINRLKLGKLSRNEIKCLKSNNVLRKQFELRDDQVRVIFYPLTDNNYIIVGVLTKKKDNDNDGYSKMAFRNKEIDISTPEKYIKEQEKSKLAEERFLKFIEDNKRKGTSR